VRLFVGIAANAHGWTHPAFRHPIAWLITSDVSAAACAWQAQFPEPKPLDPGAILPEVVVTKRQRGEGVRPLPDKCRPTGICHYCGCSLATGLEEDAQTRATPLLMHTNFMKEVRVVTVVCAQCGTRNAYDGLEDAILNLDNVLLATHEFLQL
jgi:CxC4 like cysteine cluster associated with KDZ transposases